MTRIRAGLVRDSVARPPRTRRLSPEVSHQLDVPTLHTIGMLRRAKLPIRPRMVMRLSRYAGVLGGGNKGGRQQRICDRLDATRSMRPFIAHPPDAAVQAVQSLGHSLPG